MLGEPNTEQFEIVTELNGETIHRQKIHDPFIRTTTKIKGVGAAWKALTKGLEVVTRVNGTHEAMQDVMMLNPVAMQERARRVLEATDEHPAVYKNPTGKLVAGASYGI